MVEEIDEEMKPAENFDLDDIVVVEQKQAFDTLAYDGKKIPIATATPKFVQDMFVDDVYTPDSTKMRWVMEIETVPLKVLDAKGNETDKDLVIPLKDGSSKKVTVRKRFGLQTAEVNGKVQPVVSKHPNSKLWQMMRKKGITKVSELPGKLVTLGIQLPRDETDDRKFLTITG
jgi:hypothetical protein